MYIYIYVCINIYIYTLLSSFNWFPRYINVCIDIYMRIPIYIYVYFFCVVDSLHMAFMSHSLVGSRVALPGSHISGKHIVNN